jgi:hypothetical protein
MEAEHLVQDPAHGEYWGLSGVDLPLDSCFHWKEDSSKVASVISLPLHSWWEEEKMI